MANASNPLRNPTDYDFVEMAGRENPGIAIVSGFKRAFGWDVKKGKGTKGATLTLADYPPCEGSIKFLLWLEEHFDDWVEFRQLFNYDSSKKPASAVDIYHPTLAEIGVNSVVCKDISAMTNDGKGLWSIDVSLIEYWPPPKVSSVSTPSGSKTGDGKGPGAPVDPVLAGKQQQIADLLAKAGKLP